MKPYWILLFVLPIPRVRAERERNNNARIRVINTLPATLVIKQAT